jgi:hypothetical protein
MKKNRSDKTDLDQRLSGLFNQSNSGYHRGGVVTNYIVQPGDYEKSIQALKSKVESITSAEVKPSNCFLSAMTPDNYK